jgi:hypothetical protein
VAQRGGGEPGTLLNITMMSPRSGVAPRASEGTQTSPTRQTGTKPTAALSETRRASSWPFPVRPARQPPLVTRSAGTQGKGVGAQGREERPPGKPRGAMRPWKRESPTRAVCSPPEACRGWPESGWLEGGGTLGRPPPVGSPNPRPRDPVAAIQLEGAYRLGDVLRLDDLLAPASVTGEIRKGPPLRLAGRAPDGSQGPRRKISRGKRRPDLTGAG